MKLHDGIIRIYTNSFSKEEVELLASSITVKLNILTRVVHDRNNQYVITISKSQGKGGTDPPDKTGRCPPLALR